MGYRNKLPRHPSDEYLTDPNLAEAITLRLSQLIPPPSVIVEPSAGSGAFVKAARSQWPSAHITAVEVREEVEAACMTAGADAFAFEDWEAIQLLRVPNLIIGNPPYFAAERHIRRGMDLLAPGGHLGFLLRMAFLNSQKRVKSFWDTQPGLRFLLPFARRPSFTGNGKTEHSEYAFYILEKGFTGNAEILPHLWWTPSYAEEGEQDEEAVETEVITPPKEIAP